MDSPKKENCEVMEFNSKTKVGLTFGEIISLVFVVGSFVIGYADLSWRISNIENKHDQYIEQYRNQQEINSQLTKSTATIEQSLIRIEGKLDLKQDRFK